MMKTMFENPEIEVLKFAVADVITVSTDSESNENAGGEDGFA